MAKEELSFFKKTGTILTVIVSTLVILGFLSTYIKSMSVAEAISKSELRYVTRSEFALSMEKINDMADDIKDIRKYLMRK